MSSRRRRKQNRTGRICISLIIMMFLGAMSVQIVNLYHKKQECEARAAQVQQEYEEATQRQEDLKEYEAYMKTGEAIEEIARSRVNLFYENEIVFREDKAQ